jgi:hypothetical protein
MNNLPEGVYLGGKVVGSLGNPGQTTWIDLPNYPQSIKARLATPLTHQFDVLVSVDSNGQAWVYQSMPVVQSDRVNEFSHSRPRPVVADESLPTWILIRRGEIQDDGVSLDGFEKLQWYLKIDNNPVFLLFEQTAAMIDRDDLGGPIFDDYYDTLATFFVVDKNTGFVQFRKGIVGSRGDNIGLHTKIFKVQNVQIAAEYEKELLPPDYTDGNAYDYGYPPPFEAYNTSLYWGQPSSIGGIASDRYAGTGITVYQDQFYGFKYISSRFEETYPFTWFNLLNNATYGLNETYLTGEPIGTASSKTLSMKFTQHDLQVMGCDYDSQVYVMSTLAGTIESAYKDKGTDLLLGDTQMVLTPNSSLNYIDYWIWDWQTVPPNG